MKDRVERIRERQILWSKDIERDLSWKISSGQHFFKRFSSELNRSHKWCFIVGCNNSGTSLLQTILERSGQVSTLPNEGQRYTKTLCRANRRGYERVWSEYLHSLRMTAEDSLECLPRLLHDLMREYSLPFKDIFVEKTTVNAVRMGWLQKAFTHSYFISIVRNGYAVVEGIKRKGNKSVERGARHWNLVNKIMMEDTVYIKNFLEVRYEDLVQNQEESIERIAKFLDINTDSLKNAVEQKYSFTTVRGDSLQSITNLNSDCIQRLTNAEVEIIQDEAGEMLDYFGYKL